MSQALEIKKNSFYSFISMFARNVANAVAQIIISNYYSKDSAGQFLSAILYGAIMIQLADFGLDLLLTTEIARVKEKAENTFSKLLSIKIIFALLAVVTMVGIAVFNTTLSGTTRIMILIMSLYSAFSALNNFYTALFRGFERLVVDAKISIVGNTFIVILVLICSVCRMNIIYIPIIYVLSRLLSLLQAVYYSRKIVPKIGIKFSLDDFRTVKKKILNFGLNTFCGNIFSQWDSLILQHMRGEAAFAVYQAAARIYQIPATLLDVLLNGFVPVLARLHRSDENKWNLTGFILNKILIVIAIPVLLIFYLFAEQIIKLLYFKQDFSGAIEVLQLFGFLVFIKFVTETAAYMLTTSGQQGKRMKIVVAATFLSIPIYIFFIDKYGVAGSIMAHLIANGLVGLSYIILIFGEVKQWFFEKRIIVTIILSVAMLVLLLVLRPLSMFIVIPIFLILYSLFVLKYTLNSEEREYFLPNVENYLKALFHNKHKNKF